jgi:hypothetical protein
VDFKIELGAKPTFEYIDFQLTTQALRGYLQPPLPQWDIDNGSERPDNVVNSIAFYHATKRGMQQRGESYMVGKAFHLYRMGARGNDGDRSWTDWLWYPATNTARLLLPKAWMASARYPVTLGSENWGYTTAGSSTSPMSPNFLFTCETTASPAADGTLDSMSVHSRDSGDAFKLHLYDSNDDSLAASTVEGNTGAGSDWVQVSASGSPSVAAATVYYLCHHSGRRITVSYDSLGDGYMADYDSYADGPPDPANWYSPAGDATWSIYATSTPSAGGPDADDFMAAIQTTTHSSQSAHQPAQIPTQIWSY